MASKSLAQLILYAMGGGWGDEQPGAGKVGVAVIRGTDIPKLRVGDHSSVPFRYESESKVRSRLLQVGDIVIEVSGGSAASGQHTGRALLVTTEVLQSLGGKVIPASFCRLLRLDAQQVHPGFVVRQIDSLHQSGEIAEFENQSTGIANFQFNRFVEETYPRIKDLDAQTTIAEYISSLDRLISFNRRTNQTLQAMAQAIFKSWFVDFDLVKAKIAAIEQGEDPLRAAMRAISGKTDAELDQIPREHLDQLAATAALFPDAMEESECGEIPNGWSHGVLGDACSFTAGSAFKPEHQGSTEGDYPFIKVSDMNLAGNEVFIHSANNYVSKAQRSEMKAKLHPLGATVFAKIGVALISNRRRLLTMPTIIDNNLMSASPIEGKSGAYFLYSMLSNIDFNRLVSGTALPYLNVSDLKKIPVVLPPHDVCCAFEQKASSIFSLMQALVIQSSTLADTRDNLLPKLLSGEVELSEALEG